MPSAVVIGASGGIGAALCNLLREEDSFDRVIGLSRKSTDGAPPMDITDEASVAAAATWLSEQDIAPELVIVATGILHETTRGPEKALSDLDPDWLAHVYRVNAIGPALVAKHFLPLMPRDRRSVFAMLSAKVGSISDNRLGGWYGYRASKAALNMLVRNLAIEWARTHKRGVVVALHPGTVDTQLSKPFQANVPAGKLFDSGRAAGQLLDVIDGLRPADSGRLFGWDGAEIAP